MFGLDLFIIAVTIAATFLVIRQRNELKASRAQYGAWLVLVGLWVLTTVYITDLASMTVLPRFIGMPAAMTFMGRLHTVYAWYSSTAATAMIAAGLTIMLNRLMQETSLRRESLRQLELRKEQFDQAAHLANLGYYIYDPLKEVIEFCTETHARNHGLSVEEYIRKASTLSNDMPLIHPDDREELRAGYRRVQRGEVVRLSYRAMTKEGTRQVREIVKPIYDASGNITRELGTTLDVTDHIETEKLFIHSQKHESIGQLTGGVAHDFNNLLAVILGNLEFLEEDLKQRHIDEKIWGGHVKASLSAAQKGAELVKSLLSFARKASLDPETLDLNDLISETDDWLRRTQKSNINTEVILHEGLWKTRIDRAAAQSALVNLVINAQHAMPEGGKLTIETSNVHVSDDFINEGGEVIQPGRYVVLAVTDTGIGIDRLSIDKIFDPFFTTRNPGEGSGLGLSMVQGFLRQSGGAIRVNSEVGLGTTFRLYFPADDNSSSEPAADPIADHRSNLTGIRVLLAEDQADVNELLVRVLSQSGFDVVPAHSGDEALNLFEQSGDFDILITDIVMPGNYQGPALAEAIRKLDPGMPVVFMSGYASDGAVDGNELKLNEIRLAKPVPRDILLEAINEAFNANNRSPRQQLAR